MSEDSLNGLQSDPDEAELKRLVEGLIGEVGGANPTPDVRDAAAMALYHGRRIGLGNSDAFDVLAALCLVLGEKRNGFFSNIFVARMLSNRNLKPREKLHRLIEIIIGSARAAD